MDEKLPVCFQSGDGAGWEFSATAVLFHVALSQHDVFVQLLTQFNDGFILKSLVFDQMKQLFFLVLNDFTNLYFICCIHIVTLYSFRFGGFACFHLANLVKLATK